MLKEDNQGKPSDDIERMMKKISRLDLKEDEEACAKWRGAKQVKCSKQVKLFKTLHKME